MYQISEYDKVSTLATVNDEMEIKCGETRSEYTDRFVTRDTWIELADGSRHEIDARTYNTEIKAFTRLWQKIGGFPIETGHESVPIEVALEGNAAIAVYLILIGGLTRKKVAEKMGVQKATVGKYVSEYKRGKRD